MAKLKDAARKSGLFIVSDSDLDFNQPVVRVNIDRSKANDLGITMAQVGATLETLLGGNYINRFNLEGRSYQVIPQVPRGMRLSPESLGGYMCRPTPGSWCRCRPSCRSNRDRSQFADALQPAQLRDLPGGADAGRHGRTGRRFPRGAAKNLPAGYSHYYSRIAEICSGRQSACHRVRLRADHHFPGAGGAVRKPARSPGDLDQRADGDLRRVDTAVLRRRHNQHLYPGRAADPDRIDQQARHPDGQFANELQLKEGLDKRSAIEMAARVRLRPILMTTAAMVTGLLPLLTATGAAPRAGSRSVSSWCPGW